jgi:hypothetical protein
MAQTTERQTVEQRWRVELPVKRPGKITDNRLGMIFTDGEAVVRSAREAEQCRLCGYKVTKLDSAIIGKMVDAEEAVAARSDDEAPEDSSARKAVRGKSAS